MYEEYQWKCWLDYNLPRILMSCPLNELFWEVDIRIMSFSSFHFSREMPLSSWHDPDHFKINVLIEAQLQKILKNELEENVNMFPIKIVPYRIIWPARGPCLKQAKKCRLSQIKNQKSWLSRMCKPRVGEIKFLCGRGKK